jgi:hypothetical protein
MYLSAITKLLCGAILVTVPTIEFGGAFLLRLIVRNDKGYLSNPVRQKLFRAGHAHAGVLVLLSLICQVLSDSAVLPPVCIWAVRLGPPVAAILMPMGFFLSILHPTQTRPGKAIWFVFAGAGVLAVTVVALGVGLLRAGLTV